MNKEKRSLFYPAIKGAVKLFYPKMEAEGAENLPQEAAIIVGNHTQMNGPIACGAPKHRVVPYNNVPRREYPYNIP